MHMRVFLYLILVKFYERSLKRIDCLQDKIITNGDVKYTETKDADDKDTKPHGKTYKLTISD